MKSVALSGNKRTDRGTTDAKSLRKENKIPAVIYGGKENIHFTVDEVKFSKIIHSPDVYFIDLDIDGTTCRAIIKEVQFHPVTDRAIHIDFLEIVAGKEVTVNMPVKITGNSPGVSNGGTLRVVTRKLTLKGMADALPEFVEVDITPLKIGDSIKVGSLDVEGLEFLDAANAVIVAVKMSRNASTDEEEEEEGAEGAEAETTEAAAE